jgi:hypothetical protein
MRKCLSGYEAFFAVSKILAATGAADAGHPETG